MKIISKKQEEISLVEFADTYELYMVTEERPVPVTDNRRYWAWLDGVLDESKNRRCGIGATEEEAIADYAQGISFSTVFVNLAGNFPKMVKLPRVVYESVEK